MKYFSMFLAVWVISGITFSVMSKEIAEAGPNRALVQKDLTNDGFHLICGDPFQVEKDTQPLIHCFRVKSPTRPQEDPMVCKAGPKIIDCGTIF